ncbi:MAG: PEP-CTERM sorting domain-containing protein [Desulforhopalus sp.]
MIRISTLASVLLLVLCMLGSANATSYYEEYSGYQCAIQGKSFNFGFDFRYDNRVKTNSRLRLTHDAAGAFGPWKSATLFVDLYSTDRAYEKAGFTLKAWNKKGKPQERFNLGKYKFDNSKSFVFDFTVEQLAAFDDWGWGNVRIAALGTNWCDPNDFGIERVGMEVRTDPVPEPSTVLLMGAGLLGLVGYSRKRSRKTS